MKIKNPELDSLLGGRWAISLKGALISLPFVIFAAPLGNISTHSGGSFLKWTVTSAISALPSWVLYAFAGITLFRHRAIRPVPWWWIVVLGAVLGAIKGALMAYIGYKSGLDTNSLGSSLQRRTLNHLVIGVSLFPMITLILAGYERYSLQRNRLLRQALSRGPGATHLHKGALAESDLRSRVKVERALAEASNVLRGMVSKNGALDGQQIAAYLRNQSVTAIRPLSHKLWESQVLKLDIRRLRGAIRWGIANMQLHIGAVFFVYIITAVGSFFKIGIFQQNLKHFVLHLAALLGVLVVLKKLIQNFGRNSLSRKGMLTILAAIAYDWVAMILSRLLSHEQDLIGAFILDAVWVVFIIFATSTLISIFTNTENLKESLKAMLTEAELAFEGDQQALSNVNREIARYLHSHLQSAMLNSANVIERAESIGDNVAIREEVERILSEMELPNDEMLSDQATSLEAALKRSKTNWDGLMKVRSQFVGADKKSTPTEIKKVETVLDEALSNAFRHGKAKNVEIGLRVDRDALHISVTDDGLGPQGGNEGMGSQTFDSIGGSEWSLRAGDGKGTIFSITLSRS